MSTERNCPHIGTTRSPFARVTMDVIHEKDPAPEPLSAVLCAECYYDVLFRGTLGGIFLAPTPEP